MAELTLQSAGTSLREIDRSGATGIRPSGIPAGVISPTTAGPAFVPTTVATYQDHRTIFGDPTTNIKFGSMAAKAWLDERSALTQIRVLGAGDTLRRTQSGLNTGKVTNAGFVVGDWQPQSTLTGALGHNPYANHTSLSSPLLAGIPGRAYLLGCFMSQSGDSTFFSSAGLAAEGVPVVRGYLMAASGVIMQLSTSTTDSIDPGQEVASLLAPSITTKGAFTGSVNLSSGRQEFVVILNGHKATLSEYPRILTASFDPNASNYFGTIFNTDPLKMEEAGYLLYTQYEVMPGLAVPTGSGIISASVGGTGYENIAFLITGSQTRNSGSATAPNYENFETRYEAASTSWITSQKFGSNPVNLFKLHTLSDGHGAQRKITIENIIPGTDANPYGSFDIVIRPLTDNDNNRVELESWRGLNLDPTSDRYIARAIGDLHLFYNFDASVGSQKFEIDGEFENRSKYVRVELSDELIAGEVDPSAVPFGFRGMYHLVTSGTEPLPNVSDNNYFVSTDVLTNTVQPPVLFRTSLARGQGTSKIADRKLCWGVQTERVSSVSEPNGSLIFNTSIPSLVKYLPRFQTDWINVSVRDNNGAADTAANGIVDADRFCNNGFSLGNVKITYNTTSGAPNLLTMKDWTYVRAGGVTTDSGAGTRALAVSDLSDATVRQAAKFTLLLEGGFDGTRIFNADTAYLTNQATVEEVDYTARGGVDGPTVLAYKKALEIAADTTEVDIQLLTMPGIRNRYLTDTALDMVANDRFDCLVLMDVEEKDLDNNDVTSTTQDVSVRLTANDFLGRGLNNSFGAAYFPDLLVTNTLTNTVEQVPPTVGALGAFALNDTRGYPWFAPAGERRGVVIDCVETALRLNRDNLDTLYTVGINPIVSFGNSRPMLWGQKTLKAEQSAFQRINVRRLLLALRREVKAVGLRILFEPSVAATIAKFESEVKPILKRFKDAGGLTDYVVKIDSTTTTQADIENKLIRGKIFVAPARTLEFLSIDFVTTSSGTFATS